MRIRPPLDPGQEWVWDYPRPPRLERSRRVVRVLAGGIEVVRSDRALQRTAGSSFCEWKGVASYYDFVAGERRIARAAWIYTDPTPSFAELANYVAFYPSRVDECFVGYGRVQPQVGDFYGGWITSEILGPFKGTLTGFNVAFGECVDASDVFIGNEEGLHRVRARRHQRHRRVPTAQRRISTVISTSSIACCHATRRSGSAPRRAPNSSSAGKRMHAVLTLEAFAEAIATVP